MNIIRLIKSQQNQPINSPLNSSLSQIDQAHDRILELQQNQNLCFDNEKSPFLNQSQKPKEPKEVIIINKTQLKKDDILKLKTIQSIHKDQKTNNLKPKKIKKEEIKQKKNYEKGTISMPYSISSEEEEEEENSFIITKIQRNIKYMKHIELIIENYRNELSKKKKILQQLILKKITNEFLNTIIIDALYQLEELELSLNDSIITSFKGNIEKYEQEFNWLNQSN
ncbi:hypothetical protein EDI_298520 [Entamoeba dispar SAW760]|uniref:Uncharacterized protein n=1 Tax=Entamoeba dispar (strain ATCC PRA-260 / SAW760) TaxID=370354 RepID=B0E6L4_ENTDS|nr:uncharacterized protein EDI_298520 [Entamoeba dispar SAW760]EDR29847.1 hypothetical protein EDI_298520 [Entamoeba dispar SAW760]|eukprot:EDR29847.1 hypothetical protein EDI_298520 [Entamoeba dispar SAW760]